MMSVLLALAATAARPAAPLQVVTLHCGDVNLRLTSAVAADPAAPLAPTAQTLVRQVGGRQRPVPLGPSHRVRVGGVRVPDRYVASWACVTAQAKASYVLLGYACATEPNAGICAGRREWFRVLDARGRFVDAGIPDDGPVRDRLYDRIGIAAAMAAGVAMRPAVQ